MAREYNSISIRNKKLIKEKMMTRPTRIEINCTTGVQSIIDLTDEEIAEQLAIQEQAQVERLEREAQAEALATLKTSAKAKLVAGEPLTEEEASVLVI
jgi:hypothetical protein